MNNIDRISMHLETVNNNLSLIDEISDNDNSYLLRRIGEINNKIELIHEKQLEDRTSLPKSIDNFNQPNFSDKGVDSINSDLQKQQKKDYSNKKNSSLISHEIFNLGNNNPIPLMKFVNLLEKEFQIESIKEFKEMQLGDVKSTYADISAITKFTGVKPKTNIELGIKSFVKWYKEFYIKNET